MTGRIEQPSGSCICPDELSGCPETVAPDLRKMPQRQADDAALCRIRMTRVKNTGFSVIGQVLLQHQNMLHWESCQVMMQFARIVGQPHAIAAHSKIGLGDHRENKSRGLHGLAYVFRQSAHTGRNGAPAGGGCARQCSHAMKIFELSFTHQATRSDPGVGG